jgi:TolB-like protein/Tfp pilus assembly protein PilF
VVEAGKACPFDASLSEEACRAQVAKIIESADFDATNRERQFLHYVVEETLAGRAARIKAYSIATEVFDREDSFDPQNDPIVRIEAGRLRRALERYYLMSGATDRLVITIPKGAYVPVFSLRDVQGAEAGAQTGNLGPAPDPTLTGRQPRLRLAYLAAALVGLAIVVAAGAFGLRQVVSARAGLPQIPELSRLYVEPFEDLGGTTASKAITVGLTQEVIGRLSRFRDIIVIVAEPEGAKPAPYVLQGSISLMPEDFRLRVRLVDRSDGAVLWAESYGGSLEVEPLVQAQVDIADTVAARLAQADGVIFQADARNLPAKSPESWEAYRCVLTFHALRATMDRNLIPDTQACLKKVTTDFPDYSTGWALLALSELDALRSRFPHDENATDAAIQDALQMARRAVSLDPQNVRALQAEMLALFLDRQFEAGTKVGARALDLNPNDAELLGEYGRSLSRSGNWQAGCPLLRKASERLPNPSDYQDTGLAMCAYFTGDLDEATSVISAATGASHPISLLVAAAIHAEAGDAPAAQRAAALLRQKAPEMLTDIRAEVAFRLGSPDDVDRFMRSLAKAGLTEAVRTD